jgi:hypothetical protein
MSFLGRIRYLFGISFIVLAVVGLFVYLNYSMSNVTSRSATLESDAYTVSVEYGGMIEHQYVAVGDTVKKGQELFELRSASLADAIRLKQVDQSSLLYSLNPQGNIVLTASKAGVVRQVNFLEGSFVSANSPIAQIDVADSGYVTSRYLLRAPDYARINRDNPIIVTLPDNSRLSAKVFDISLQRDGEAVYTVVKARFDKGAKIPPTFTSGTPVTTTWQLNSNEWYNSILNFLKSLFEPTTQV